jgi:hypothetical protein
MAKDFSEFYSGRPDCKECKKAQASKSGKVYYQKNKERYKELHHKHYVNNKAYYNAKNAKRRASLLNATPSWVDVNELNYIYKLAKDKNLVVDHIIPLVHSNVCGLHVPANLRCISQEWNAKKSNKLINK